MTATDSPDVVPVPEEQSASPHPPSRSQSHHPPEHFQLFASPNWYDACVVDILPNGVAIAASRNLVLYLALEEGEPDAIGGLHESSGSVPGALAGGGGSGARYLHKLMLLRQLRAHQERIVGVVAKPYVDLSSSEGPQHRFLSCAQDSLMRLWSYEQDACLRELNLATVLSGASSKVNKPTCVATSPSPSTPLALVGMEGGQLVLWNHEADRAAVTSGKQAEKDGHPFHVAWSTMAEGFGGPVGEEYIAVGFKRGSVAVYSLQHGGATGSLELRPMHRLRAHDDDVVQLAWNPRYRPEEDSCPDLATAARDRSVKLWRLSSRRCVAQMRIPLSGATQSNERSGADDGQKKGWTSICWPASGQGELYATTMYGDILICTASDGDYSRGVKTQVLAAGSRGLRSHNRMIFALREHVTGRWMLSVGQDRQIGAWSLTRGGGLLCSVPTIGGFVYALDVHPNNPNLLAIGCGDNTIRLWRQAELPTHPYNVQPLWQGLNGRVTALAWHPVREGLLALGTEDGRVGVLDSMHASGGANGGGGGKFLPRFSHHHHKGQVYRVQWGPMIPPPAGGGAGGDSFMLYSVGNYQLRRHSASNLSREPMEIGQLLPRPQGHDEELKFSDIAWRSDLVYFAVGLDSGTVLVYSCRPLACVANLALHNKCVNCIQWHPGFEEAALNWLAVATCEHNVSVTDLGPALDRFEKSLQTAEEEESELPGPIMVTECMSRLSGHGNRIVDLSWSPHEAGLLLSASFDGTAQVWDVQRARDHGVANFRGHHGRVYCCQWSWSDSDLVFSGGEDYCVIGWRPSQQEHTLPTRGRRYRVQLPTGVKAVPHTSSSGGPASSKGGSGSRRVHTVSGGSSVGDPASSLEELKGLLEEKRTELASNGSAEAQTAAAIVGEHPELTKLDAVHLQMANASAGAGGDKGGHKRKRPGLFANTNTSVPMDIRRKQDDLVDLAYRLNMSQKSSSHSPNHSTEGKALPAYLAVFLRSTPGLMDFCLEPEISYQLRTGHVDNYLTLLIWSGRASDAVSEAQAAEYLPDWLMAVTCGALARDLVDETLVQAKARLLVQQQGDVVLAVTYLLACDCLPQAMALLKEKQMYREAVVLHLLHQGAHASNALSELYASWAGKELSNGAYEMAAKAWLAADRIDEAVKVLSKRQSLYSCWTLARILLACGRKRQAEHWLRQLTNRALTDPGEEEAVVKEWREILAKTSTPSLYRFLNVFDVYLGIRFGALDLGSLGKAVQSSQMPEKPVEEALDLDFDSSLRSATAQWPQAFAYFVYDLTTALSRVEASQQLECGEKECLRKALGVCAAIDPDETKRVKEQLMGDVGGAQMHDLVECLRAVEV